MADAGEQQNITWLFYRNNPGKNSSEHTANALKEYRVMAAIYSSPRIPGYGSKKNRQHMALQHAFGIHKNDLS